MNGNYYTDDEMLLYNFINKVGCINEMQIYKLLENRPEARISTHRSLGLLIRQNFLYEDGHCITASPKGEVDKDIITALWVFINNMKSFDENVVGSTFAGMYPSSLVFATDKALAEVVVIDDGDMRKLQLLDQRYQTNNCCEDDEDNSDDLLKYKYILVFKNPDMVKNIPTNLAFVKDNAYICMTIDSRATEAYEYNENFENGLEDMPEPIINYIY